MKRTQRKMNKKKNFMSKQIKENKTCKINVERQFEMRISETEE